jgi:hypothetical protein
VSIVFHDQAVSAAPRRQSEADGIGTDRGDAILTHHNKQPQVICY